MVIVLTNDQDIIAVSAWLIQDDLRESLRNLGLARASNFSWQRTVRETLAVYAQGMARKDK